MTLGFFVGQRRYRRTERKRIIILALFGYNELLLTMFIYGLLTDDGFGWAFLPLMICTAPWSFLASDFAQGPFGAWLVSGLIGNFVLFVGLCGGMNTLLLYGILRRTSYPTVPAARRTIT